MPIFPKNAILGADISHYQASVDLTEAKSTGLQFIILKASEGEHTKDGTFSTRRKAAHAVGFKKVGMYHFLHGDQDAETQATNFLNALDWSLSEDEFVVLDVEAGAGWEGQAPDNSVALIEKVVFIIKTALGLHGSDFVLYTSLGWARDTFGKALEDLTFMKLWAARYEVPSLGDTSPWSEALIWQYDEYGSSAGLGNKSVDLDVWMNPATFVSPPAETS